MKIQCIIGVVNRPKVELTLANDADMKRLQKYNIHSPNFIAYSTVVSADLTGRHGMVSIRPARAKYEANGLTVTGYKMHITDIEL